MHLRPQSDLKWPDHFLGACYSPAILYFGTLKLKGRANLTSTKNAVSIQGIKNNLPSAVADWLPCLAGSLSENPAAANRMLDRNNFFFSMKLLLYYTYIAWILEHEANKQCTLL